MACRSSSHIPTQLPLLLLRDSSSGVIATAAAAAVEYSTESAEGATVAGRPR